MQVAKSSAGPLTTLEPWRLARCFLGEVTEVVSCALRSFTQARNRPLRGLHIVMGREGCNRPRERAENDQKGAILNTRRSQGFA